MFAKENCINTCTGLKGFYSVLVQFQLLAGTRMTSYLFRLVLLIICSVYRAEGRKTRGLPSPKTYGKMLNSPTSIDFHPQLTITEKVIKPRILNELRRRGSCPRKTSPVFFAPSTIISRCHNMCLCVFLFGTSLSEVLNLHFFCLRSL